MITRYPYVYYLPNDPLKVRMLGRRCRILAHIGNALLIIQFLDGTRAVAHPRDLTKENGK